MKTFIAFLMWVFSRKRWVLVEAHTAFWNINHNTNRGLEQRFIFYKIEYCPKYNKYRLRWEGENGEKHSMYGEMLQKIAALNSGIETEQYLDNLDSGVDNIIITKFPLNNEAEDVFKFSKDDPELVEAIKNVIKGLKKQSIEIFEHRGNIIATDVGYFGAFYESDLMKEDPNKDNNEKPE